MSERNRVAQAVKRRKRKFFSVQQANKSLVLLQRIVGEIIDEYNQLLQVEELIEKAEETNSTHRLGEYRKELVRLVDAVHGCLEEIDTVGVTVRDFRTGIVEFPAMYEGREIRLCWVYGDEKISYWHELDSGLYSREEIESLVPG